MRCDTCKEDRAVPLSCKSAICPSCAGRTMAERAAFLVDRVLDPTIGWRQIVVTFPSALVGRGVRLVPDQPIPRSSRPERASPGSSGAQTRRVGPEPNDGDRSIRQSTRGSARLRLHFSAGRCRTRNRGTARHCLRGSCPAPHGEPDYCSGSHPDAGPHQTGSARSTAAGSRCRSRRRRRRSRSPCRWARQA